MTIRKAAPGDLSRIMDIYHAAQEFMIQSGNPDQWAHIYPSEALVREDIQRGICHVVCDGAAIHGVFALMSGPTALGSEEWQLTPDRWLYAVRDGHLRLNVHPMEGES